MISAAPKWEVFPNGDEIHIHPLEDLDLHLLIAGICRCGPRTERVNGTLLVVHNSFDGREAFEQWEDLKGKGVQ